MMVILRAWYDSGECSFREKKLEPIRKEVESGESVVILYVAVIRDGDRRCGSPSIVEPPAAAGYVTTA
ncbi:MAG TPA: hypothetical protein VMV54_02650, partial [Acidocella sp.]|nr:hypothetical protein [Acidocella sp.]